MPTQTIDFARFLGLTPKVHQAVGMISVQINGSPEAATMRLIAEADASGRSLDCIAADVVARRMRFAPES